MNSVKRAARIAALFLPLLLVAPAPSLAAGSTEEFVAVLDAWFAGQPNRTIVRAHRLLDRGRREPFREPALYVLGRAFAEVHLYEKASDALHHVLVDYPDGEFAPPALRELARMYFGLREWGAVVNLDHDRRRSLPPQRVPDEVWYLIGQAAYLAGDPEMARTTLARVPPASRFRPFATFTSAQAAFALDRREEALAMLSGVAGDSVPRDLADRARRTRGMILYDLGRFAESLDVFFSIPQSSALHGRSRIDAALAAEALERRDLVRRALEDLIAHGSDLTLRSEGQIAFGRLFSRGGDAATARTLFDRALEDLERRESSLRRDLDDQARFEAVERELLSFARVSQRNLRRRHLREDLDLTRRALRERANAEYAAPDLGGDERFAPETALFELLHRNFHSEPLVGRLVDLAVEAGDLETRVARLRDRIASSFRLFEVRTERGEVPASVVESIDEATWLLLSHFDLVTRLYNELVIEERLGLSDAVGQKRKALTRTVEGLRLLHLGSFHLPSRAWLEGLLDRGRARLASGEIPGTTAPSIRQSLLDEYRSDRATALAVLENLQMKDKQLSAALRGIPLRSRNLNLPLLTTMIQWLDALAQFQEKYTDPGLVRSQRPWRLVGHGSDVVKVLDDATTGLREVEATALRVLRAEARRLVDEEARRHALLAAEAEEGAADALFREHRDR